MDRGLGRRQSVAVEHLAVETDHQHVVGGDAGAAGVARQDENAIGAGNAGADVAAVVEQLRHHHHAVAIGELLPQRGFGYLRHLTPGRQHGASQPPLNRGTRVAASMKKPLRRGCMNSESVAS
jgi:hypothetical protein